MIKLKKFGKCYAGRYHVSPLSISKNGVRFQWWSKKLGQQKQSEKFPFEWNSQIWITWKEQIGKEKWDCVQQKKRNLAKLLSNQTLRAPPSRTSTVLVYSPGKTSSPNCQVIWCKIIRFNFQQQPTKYFVLRHSKIFEISRKDYVSSKMN